MMKCHGLSPSRSATGGLAAKLSIMPTAMSRIRADSNCLSIVHHHSASGVLRSRANMCAAALPGGSLEATQGRTIAPAWLARCDRDSRSASRVEWPRSRGNPDADFFLSAPALTQLQLAQPDQRQN